MINYVFSTGDFEYFLMILIRTASFVFAAPFFSMANTPNRVKIGVSVVLSYLIYQVLYPHDNIVYNTILGYSALILKEAGAGLCLGAMTNFCSSIVILAGRIVDMDMGLAMANIFDPTTRDQVSLTGQLFNYGVLMMLIVSGMHRYLIKAFIEAYEVVPVGSVVMNGDRLLNAILTFLIDYIVIGFRICLPIFAAILIVNAVLGILAKIAPQMNMFSVGIQIKLFVGLTILLLTTAMLPSAASFIFEELKKMMVLVVESLH